MKEIYCSCEDYKDKIYIAFLNIDYDIISPIIFDLVKCGIADDYCENSIYQEVNGEIEWYMIGDFKNEVSDKLNELGYNINWAS